jgi:hypothetical protein
MLPITKGTEMKLYTGIRNAALQRPFALAMFFILLSITARLARPLAVAVARRAE